MDISKYKGIYLQEARTHLAEIESGLLSLEKDPSQKDVLDALFRHYHSIKGMSASMGYTPVTRLAHAEEDLLDKLRSGKLALNSGMTTALLKCLAALRELTGRGGGEVAGRGEDGTGRAAPRPPPPRSLFFPPPHLGAGPHRFLFCVIIY